jgi:regulator of sirC expression with transglutaminase-like and TPR domain
MSASLPSRAPTALEYFAALVADDRSLNLLEAAIAIAQDESPLLDVQAVLAEIDALALKLSRRLAPDATALHKLRLLNHFFHDELGFAGNVNNYYASENSYVHRVLLTRRGIPITLALIYMELAAQIGLRAAGVAFPGHFLVKLHLPQGEVVLDPFSCQTLSRQALDEALLPYRDEVSGTLRLEEVLRDAQPREVLVRMLRNLKEIHRATGDLQRQLAVQQRLLLLLPDDARELRDRALTLEALGHDVAAAADLQRYLSLRPLADDAALLRQRLRRLQSRPGPSLH